MMNYFITLLQLSCLVVTIASPALAEYVPVLIWDSTQSSSLTPALEPLTQDTFQTLLLERIDKGVPLLVFAEENLSLEDFSLYDGQGKSAFSQMSTLKTSDYIIYSSFVKSPMSVIQALPERNVTKVPIESVLDDKELSLDNYNVVIINMNDATDGEGRISMLKRHDAYVAKIYNMLAKVNKNFVAIFTGYHSSWSSPEELLSHRQRRDVEGGEKALNVNGSLVFINSYGILYLNSTPILFNNGTNVTLDELSFSTNVSSPDELHILLSNKDITLDFLVLMDESYWTIPNISVSFKDAESSFVARVKEVYAPMSWSYHCSSFVFTNLDNQNQKVELPGFQFQPFNASSNVTSFGDSYDCVPFMTIPILSGIFVTIILALIMTFGLTIIMSIKTMDRFDDPKGKTITISATD